MDLASFLLDGNAVLAAYDRIVQTEANWFMLCYNGSNDRLLLHKQGAGDLSQLKSCITDLERIYIAFYHQVPSGGFVLVNYIPNSISGVRRARALVHSRRIGASLIKTEHATLTVDHISNITQTSIREAILNPESVHNIQINQSFTSINDPTVRNDMQGQIRRSFTETYAPSFSPPPPPAPVAKSVSMFSSLLRRKNKDVYSSPPAPPVKQDAFSQPPPPPPKDNLRVTSSRSDTPLTKSIPKTIPLHNSDLMSDFAVISHSFSSDEFVMEPPLKVPDGGPSRFIMPVEKKWIPEATFIPDPTERARRRQLIQEQRQKEEEEAIRAEDERLERLRLEKEEMLRQEQEDEEKRRASLEEELQRARSERRMKEEQERAEDKRKREEIESRKRADRQRRQEEHKKLEEWRQKQAKLALESESREVDARKQEEAERKEKILRSVAQVKKDVHNGEIITGWATLQTSDSLVWKRRYFKLIGFALFFYRSEKDLDQVLDEMNLENALMGVREWYEGFEELKAIPNSFAMEYKDGRESCAVYTDSEEEKTRLLGILYFGGGLKL